MEIGDWRATRDLNDLYPEIRELDLKTKLTDLEAFGFTVIEDALEKQLCESLRDAVVAEAERRLSCELWLYLLDWARSYRLLSRPAPNDRAQIGRNLRAFRARDLRRSRPLRTYHDISGSDHKCRNAQRF